jgi:hypothetical protein
MLRQLQVFIHGGEFIDAVQHAGVERLSIGPAS